MRTRRILKVTRTDSRTASKRRAVRTTKSDRQPAKPKTAYELLERVCDHILEEPKRYTQEIYLARGDASIEAMGLDAPACGTIGCRAGWIVLLHDGPTLRRDHVIADRANDILDVSHWDTSELFSGESCDRLAGENTSPMIGTKKYARLGVKGLRAFMREHKAHLQARLLKDVPKLGAK